MKKQTSVLYYDKGIEVQRASITQLGRFEWRWVYYPDPNMCKSTDPHGVAPFKFVAKLQIMLAKLFHKA